MPSCVIRFSGFRRRAHPRAQTAPLGARHISLKRVRQSIIRRRRRAASLDLEEILFRCCLSMPIGARPHTSNGLFVYLFPLSTEYTDVCVGLQNRYPTG